MNTGILTIDVDATMRNRKAPDRPTAAWDETAATFRAIGYGFRSVQVAHSFPSVGARSFFTSDAHGATIRKFVGDTSQIFRYSGHMRDQTTMAEDLRIFPLPNAAEQLNRLLEAQPGAAIGIQPDSGTNRLGRKPGDWSFVRRMALQGNPRLPVSCPESAEEPDCATKRRPLSHFREKVGSDGTPLSLVATGGFPLGRSLQFDLIRPGTGLHGACHTGMHTKLPRFRFRLSGFALSRPKRQLGMRVHESPQLPRDMRTKSCARRQTTRHRPPGNPPSLSSDGYT